MNRTLLIFAIFVYAQAIARGPNRPSFSTGT